jgi:hypothetical protein
MPGQDEDAGRAVRGRLRAVRGQPTPTNNDSSPRHLSWVASAARAARAAKGEHGQGDVPMPGGPEVADLEVVEADLAFRGLEALQSSMHHMVPATRTSSDSGTRRGDQHRQNASSPLSGLRRVDRCR